MYRKYKMRVKIGYSVKEFEFENYSTLAELIRCMVIGSNEVEFSILTEFVNEEENDNGEIDRRLP